MLNTYGRCLLVTYEKSVKTGLGEGLEGAGVGGLGGKRLFKESVAKSVREAGT